jgi:hypothetical protein
LFFKRRWRRYRSRHWDADRQSDGNAHGHADSGSDRGADGHADGWWY